jgi:hypothetical protein
MSSLLQSPFSRLRRSLQLSEPPPDLRPRLHLALFFMSPPTSSRDPPKTVNLGGASGVTLATAYAGDGDAADGGWVYHPGESLGSDLLESAAVFERAFDASADAQGKVAGSIAHLDFLNSLYLARLRLLHPNHRPLRELEPAGAADAGSLAAAVPEILAATPTFGLSSFSSAEPSETSLSCLAFKNALAESTVKDPSPLLLHLLDSGYAASPPNFSGASLSAYLLSLHTASQIYLPVSSFSPLLPDLALLLSLPSSPDSLSCLPSPAVFACLNKLLNGRASTPGDFFLPPPTPGHHIAWAKTFADLLNSMYPKTYKLMEQNHALTPAALSPIFERL